MDAGLDRLAAEEMAAAVAEVLYGRLLEAPVEPAVRFLAARAADRLRALGAPHGLATAEEVLHLARRCGAVTVADALEGSWQARAAEPGT